MSDWQDERAACVRLMHYFRDQFLSLPGEDYEVMGGIFDLLGSMLASGIQHVDLNEAPDIVDFMAELYGGGEVGEA